MERIKVNVLHVTPLHVALNAVGKPYKKETVDEDLLYKVCNVYKHESVIEHINISLEIKNISRLCLMELTRHRLASYTVESTRFTLKDLIESSPIHNVEDWCVKPQLKDKSKIGIIQAHNAYSLIQIVELLNQGFTQDEVKYMLPESFRTDLIMTLNVRVLNNLLELRDSTQAHFEIRHLAQLIRASLKNEKIYRFLHKNEKST